METTCKTLLYASALFFLLLIVCGADDGNPGDGNPGMDTHGPPEGLPEGPPQGPPEIVGKALACFNQHADTCKPDQRLSQSGTIDVPRDETDEYCNGGCYDQTKLVLTCIDQILSNFLFYNRATIDDIDITITEACSNTDKRGDFNVSERMDSTSHASTTSHASKGPPANPSSLTICVTLCGLISVISLIML